MARCARGVLCSHCFRFIAGLGHRECESTAHPDNLLAVACCTTDDVLRGCHLGQGS
jgi:hypothetical protein